MYADPGSSDEDSAAFRVVEPDEPKLTRQIESWPLRKLAKW